MRFSTMQHTYLPDLAQSDCHLIVGLKCDLGNRHVAMEEELQSTVAEFFVKQDVGWDRAGIHKLISRYNKCLDEQGNYVEK